MSKSNVEESTEYESCLGVVDKRYLPATLDGFIDVEEPNQNEKEWKKHWVGMPDYEQNDNPTYKTIYVHFRTKEDYDEFAKLIDQNLSEKTKSIWHPKLDRDQNSLKRWIEEDT